MGRGGRSEREAEEELRTTRSDEKNEMLFTKFGTNYNAEPAIYRKGSVIYRAYAPESESVTDDDLTEMNLQSGEGSEEMKGEEEKEKVGGEKEKRGGREKEEREEGGRKRKRKEKKVLVVCHDDVIGEGFWARSPNILLENARDPSKCFGAFPPILSGHC